MRKNLLSIKPYEPGKPIEEVKRELRLKSVIKLASNENPLGSSPKAVSAIRGILSGLNRYPDGGCYRLKQKLAAKFKVKPAQLIIGNGSDEIIVLALRAFVEAGDEIIVAKPTFLIYRLQGMACSAKVIEVPLKDYRYDLQAMKKRITKKTRIIFIANPDNPTGSYVRKSEVESFLKGIPKNVLVYFDEAYREFVEERDYADGLNYISRGNVIATRSFSKAYGLAGLRAGYGITSAYVADAINRVREPFNVNSLAQAAALAALDDADFIKKSRRVVREGKRYIYSNLKRMGFDYIPSAANFVLFKYGKDASVAAFDLLKKGVIVRGMKSWGLKEFIRVTIGTMDENRKFVKALEGI